VPNDFLTLSKLSQELLFVLAKQWVGLPAHMGRSVPLGNWDELRDRQFIDDDRQFTAYGAVYTNIGLGVQVRPELIEFLRAREKETQSERNYYFTLSKLRALLNTWVVTDPRKSTRRINLVLPDELRDFTSQLEKIKVQWDNHVEETLKAEEKARATLYKLLEHA
jgi:hypothetical protein